MPKPITGCIVNGPMSAERAEILIRILQQGSLGREELTGNIAVRERRPGDTYDMLQSVNGVSRSGRKEAV